MNIVRMTALLVALVALVSASGPGLAADDPPRSSGEIANLFERLGRAAERGSQAAAVAVERGLLAAARGVERGAHATARAADGIARKLERAVKPAPPQDSQRTQDRPDASRYRAGEA